MAARINSSMHGPGEPGGLQVVRIVYYKKKSFFSSGDSTNSQLKHEELSRSRHLLSEEVLLIIENVAGSRSSSRTFTALSWIFFTESVT